MSKLQDLQDEMRKLQAESVATENLLRDFPAGILQPEFIHYYDGRKSASQEFSFKYRVENLQIAKSIVESWSGFILPLVFSEGLYNTFIHAASQDDNGESRGCTVKNTPVNPVRVKVSQWETSFEFYVSFGGHVVSVTVEIKRENRVDVAFVSYSTRAGRYVMSHGSRLVASAFTGFQKGITSAGREYPNQYMLYWDVSVNFEDMFTSK